MQTWRDIATIVNKKGLEGGLVLQWSTGLSFVLAQGQELYIVPPRLDAPRTVHLDEEVVVGTGTEVVFFAEIEDASVAEAVVGCHLLVDSDIVPQFGEADLDEVGAFLGWEVEDSAFGLIGEVVSSEERFEQLLLEVKAPDGSAKLIPLVEDIIVDAHPETKRLLIDCPKGLLDL